MRKTLGIVIGMLSVALLFSGSIFKKKDAVRLTQTDPIGYQEKQKEETEGKKGAPAPKIRLYPEAGFLSEGPVNWKKKGPSADLDAESEWEDEGEFKPGPDSDDTWEEFDWGEEIPATKEKGPKAVS